VTYHGPPVAGPAHIELDAPYTGIDRRVKGRQGVFNAARIVVFTTVGNEAAGFEKRVRGDRTGPSTTDLVHRPMKNRLGLFFDPYFRFPVAPHGK
jgi:hypothetical protein